MMEQLEVTGALPDFDNLDVDLDGSAGLELGSGDVDVLLGATAGLDAFNMNDSDIDKLMANPPPLDEPMDDSGDIDHLKTMPIAEVDQADVILGLEPQKQLNEFEPKPLEAQTMPQWNQQPAQSNDPLLENFRREPMAQPSDSIQMIVDQGIHGPPQNNMLPHLGQNQPSVADLQSEKQKLLQRLNEINKREDQSANAFAQQTRPNGFVLQRNEHVPQQAQRSNNMFLKEPTPFSAAPVASVGGLGTGGETPLQSFLRAGRKSHMTAGQPAPGAASVLARNVAGAPRAASVFSKLPADLEAITSQSELQISNSFLNNNDSQNHLFASMDRSAVSQEMVRKLSSRSLSRSSSGRSSSGNIGNAAWGIDGSKKSGFRTSGILSKHASENHLVRKGGIALSKSKIGSLSRENALYSMMKRNSSKNLIRREDSHGQMLPTKRRSGSKHKLGLSRSVPALLANNVGGMSHGSQNARW